MINFFKTILYVPLYNILIFLAWLVPGHSIGWAIIILTVIIRMVLLPASLKAARAQAKLQALAPEMNKIKQEIKDKQEQGRALMDLYKREGVSPFGSCLPMLVQLPIIFILYQVFRDGIDSSHFSLLYSFVPRPETINAEFFGVSLAKPDLWVFPILAGATQFILSKLMMPNTPKPAADEKPQELDPMQMANKQMIYLFPLMTLFIARSLPAALSLYWIVTTVFGILQQLYVNKSIKNSPEFKKEVLEDERETEEEIERLIHKDQKGPVKKDFLGKMMDRKLQKQEKKTGVEVTIRKK